MNSNLLRRTLEPAIDAGFSFKTEIGAEMGANQKYVNYRPAKLSRGKKWYVSFQYKNPETGQFKKFKVYFDINRIKDKEEKEEFAKDLIEGVNRFLKRGGNPFKKSSLRREDNKTWTLGQALNYFKQKWAQRGIEASSFYKYERCCERFGAWLIKKGIQNNPTDSINEGVIESYLTESSRKWSNRSYNNELLFLNTIFRFLKKKQIIRNNPCEEVDRKKVITTKHKYYDDAKLTKLMEALKKDDPYLYFACQVVYYLCIRSEKELKLFKVGNILPDRKQVLINGSDSKTDRDRFIPLPTEMLDVFTQRQVLDYPPDYYVFSVSSKNKFVADGVPGPESFGRGFFSKRFGKIREKVGLSSDYTIFSLRHTRAIHMKLDGASDAEIMNVMGHTDFRTTGGYLRDIGLTVDAKRINFITRKL